MPTDAHIHGWEEATVTEIGDTYLRCRCGEERLLTGTVVRMRRPGEDWTTPYAWNRHFYGRATENG